MTRATARLAAAGVASPRVDAEILAAHVLGVNRGRLALVEGFTPQQAARYADLIARRERREPLQHLTGHAPFRHIELAVGPGVFIPRPETELLVEWGLSWLRSHQVSAPVVVDLCAGTGAVGIAVATEWPGAVVYAVEQAPSALTWLHRNAAEAGSGGAAVSVVVGDATDPNVLPGLAGKVDLVLSNPPYVPVTTALSDEVAHDPAEALYAGPDGLEVIRPLIVTAARLLRPGGAFAVEHDDSHGEAVPELLRAALGWSEVHDHRDLAGRPRFATAIRG
mgnify:CR=1 FL=1